jgi:Kef-type K+ transport system membrane component KefB
MTHLTVERVVLPLLLQLTVIILVARLFAILFRALGQPGVVGEIFAGLVLGPSLLGKLSPTLFRAIFHPASPDVSPELFEEILRWCFTTISQIGLIFLLFLIGLEFDFSHLRWHGRSALAISWAGIMVPFALGFGLALPVHTVAAPEVPVLAFALFLGTTLSITAMPVLGRMMMELNITRTRLGAVTMSAAAADDAVGWILLAAVTAVARANFVPSIVFWMAGKLILFALGMFFLLRPLLRKWVASALRQGDGEISVNTLAVLLALIFGCALMANFIGIFAVFGAFLLGVILSSEHDLRGAVTRRLRDFVTAFFLPIFFTYTGLRTDIGYLESWQLWGLCALVSVAAIVGKFGGCGLAAWLSHYSPREAACIGALMNTRALMALIAINIGKDLGVIPDSVFCMLVIMALLTTIITTPILLRVMRGTELEPFIIESGFVSGSAQKAQPQLSLERM